MKQGKLLCCLILCAAALGGSALADVIWEPRDDFYDAHAGECEYLSREYTANGPQGYLTLWEAPDSTAQEANLPNGEIVGCSWLYTAPDGEVWGGTEYGEEEENWAWFKLSETVVVPDYLTFQEEHGEEFIPYDSAYDHALDGLETVVLWKYPGSGAIVWEDADTEWFQNTSMASAFETCYLDEEGRFWGYIGYIYGVRNSWVCLSDPANPSLAKTEPEETAELIPAAETVPEPESGLPVTAIVLVGAVVIATAILIPVVCRKKKPEEPTV